MARADTPSDVKRSHIVLGLLLSSPKFLAPLPEALFVRFDAIIVVVDIQGRRKMESHSTPCDVGALYVLPIAEYGVPNRFSTR